MSRSRNSRKGQKGKHGKRHHVCSSGPTCSFCSHNFHHSTIKQSLKGT